MPPPQSLPRFAIVTGAGAGIGRSTARLLAAQGWRIGAADVDAAALQTLVAELGADRLLPLVLDVTAMAEWTAAVASFAAWSGGRLHLLVNNAGIIAVGAFSEVEPARAQRLLDVNIMGVINGVHACLALLAATAGARIINVSSIAALTGWPYSSVYSASKGAIYNLTEALNAEFGPQGITVTDVLPGFVGTQLVADEADAAEVRAMFRRFSIGFTSPGRIAQHIVAAVGSRRVHHIVGRQANVYGFIARYLPALARLMSRGFGRRYGAILARRAATRDSARGPAGEGTPGRNGGEKPL